ncbi:phosphatase PAP2 family protein [Streptomyces sp. CMB-StM0423]|uniref:phosphatase PAP2 family protein n=1 Tax=Streptomyces sp. CMB-StM0423 TaxID=2059884 RepID=UPI00131D99BF|nr:phosphatase PAP2 family protein [Streptomyces sp. CMB-StM0423]
MAAAAFAALASVVLVGGNGPLPPDTAVHDLALNSRSSSAVADVRSVTATGIGIVPYLLAVAAGLIAAPALITGRAQRPVTRLALPALTFPAWLALGEKVRYALMTQIARPRPPADDWLTHGSRWSFPSGHAAISAMAAGLLVLALLSRRPPAARLWIALVVAWAMLVGISRVWLGVHWISDVIGGWLLALAWTLLAAVVAAHIRSWWSPQESSRPDDIASPCTDEPATAP